jgi:hypothetical protein
MLNIPDELLVSALKVARLELTKFFLSWKQKYFVAHNVQASDS